MFDEASRSILIEGATRWGVNLAAEEVEHFSLYVQELQRWSKVADLVAQADTQTIIRKHILDSLAIFPLLPPQSRVLDLGSGAGFPGLVFAILGPSLDLTLVEARRKRVNFLKAVVRSAKLTNVHVYEGRAEQLAETASFQGTFHVVVTRATWDLSQFLRLAAPCLREGGMALAMKGPQVGKELLRLEQPERQNIEFSLRERFPYTLPFGGETREAVIFEKICS
jgi:16S rRNA (guanine527-N7)-methyltransferase